MEYKKEEVMKKIIFFLFFLCFVKSTFSQSDYYDYWNDRQDYYDYLDDMIDYYSTYDDYDPYDYYDGFDGFEPYYDDYYGESDGYFGGKKLTREESEARANTLLNSQPDNADNAVKKYLFGDIEEITPEEAQRVHDSFVKPKKLSPSDDIGIFVNLKNFREYMDVYFSSKNISILYRDSSSDYDSYILSNGVTIWSALNNYGSIHTIIVSIAEDGDLGAYWDIVGWIYLSTGLYFSTDNYWEIFEKFSSHPLYENEYFSMIGWFEESTEEFMTMISPNLERNFNVRSGCDSNYVGACVPVTTRNLNCLDIGVRNFFVVGTDTHFFDGDKNGVCCEPYPVF